MSELGLTGYNGTNPIKLFESHGCARTEGVHHPPIDYFECVTCGFYSTVKTCKCPPVPL